MIVMWLWQRPQVKKSFIKISVDLVNELLAGLGADRTILVAAVTDLSLLLNHAETKIG